MACCPNVWQRLSIMALCRSLGRKPASAERSQARSVNTALPVVIQISTLQPRRIAYVIPMGISSRKSLEIESLVSH